MRSIIKLTQAEADKIYNLLPNEAIYAQRYLIERALDEFKIRVHYDNHTFSDINFLPCDPATEEKLLEGSNISLQDIIPGTLIACRYRAFEDLKNSLLVKAWFLFALRKDRTLLSAYAPNYYLSPEQPQTPEEIMGYGDTCIGLYVPIQHLLLHHKEHLQYTVQAEPKQNKPMAKKRKGKNKPKSQPAKMIRVYKLVHLDEEQTREIQKRAKQERHCPAWGVRGHYRHYKSGKIAYVKPYIKGKDKSAYTGREYVLFPKLQEASS